MSKKSEKKQKNESEKVYRLDGEPNFSDELEAAFDEIDRKYEKLRREKDEG